MSRPLKSCGTWIKCLQHSSGRPFLILRTLKSVCEALIQYTQRFRLPNTWSSLRAPFFRDVHTTPTGRVWRRRPRHYFGKATTSDISVLRNGSGSPLPLQSADSTVVLRSRLFSGSVSPSTHQWDLHCVLKLFLLRTITTAEMITEDNCSHRRICILHRSPPRSFSMSATLHSSYRFVPTID